ncbi:hypothetical protein [Psychrobacillus sp. FSL K6-4046]|nr:hypothetical protein [uncultured Psychrobacillus sp.]
MNSCICPIENGQSEHKRMESLEDIKLVQVTLNTCKLFMILKSTKYEEM